MAFNSYKKDENTITAGKAATLFRLFSYLLSYKKQIIGVLFAERVKMQPVQTRDILL